MEMIVPRPLALTYEHASSVSVYANWVSGSSYNKGQPVHDALADGGDGRDYRAQAYLTNSTTRPSASSNKDWALLGVSASDVFTYDTDADLSEYDTWVSGQSAPKGKIYADEADQNDYIALEAISSGNNTIRPSVAVLSDDTAVSGRWQLIGKSNAFRMFDGRLLRKTRADSTLTCTAVATGQCDRVAFAGLRDIKTVSVTVTAGEMMPNDDFDSPATNGWNGILSFGTSYAVGEYLYKLVELVPGVEYVCAAVFSNANGVDEVRLRAREPDWDTVVAEEFVTSVSGTLTITFTATQKTMYINATHNVGGGGCRWQSVSLKQNGYVTENLSADLEYSEGEQYQGVCKLTHTVVDSPQYVVTLESKYANEEIQVGLMLAGGGEGLALSLADATDATDDYSRVEFDETYGTASLLKRGFSRRVSVTLWVQQGSAAYLAHRMRAVRSVPCLFDLNNDGNDDGLIVHGLAQRPERTTSGIDGLDTVRLEIKGLVE